MGETYRDFLLDAYYQNHPTSIPEFLKVVEDIMGKGSLLELHRFCCQKYGLPKIGTSRVTYLSKFVVFKVPVTLDGFRNNDWEASLCGIGEEGTDYHIPLARSRHLPHQDIPVVVMERITEASISDILEKLGKIPDFVSAVDSAQVGFTRKGKLVAFDYADL